MDLPSSSTPTLGNVQAHIVPRFHLGRFAMPPGRNGFIYFIEKGTGRNERVHVKSACTAKDFYIVEDKAGDETAGFEDMLQKIESYCALRIDRLVERGAKPSNDDRLTLAHYVVLTHMRTPRMREHLRWLADTWTLDTFRSTLEADPPWQRMRAAVYTDLSDEEAEALRQKMIRDIDEGNLEVEFRHRYYVVQTMEYLTDQAYRAAEMSWQVMRAPAGTEFVIGDHAVSMYDPSLAAGPQGNAMASSPFAETVLPLDRRVAVRLSFGEDKWVDEEVSPELVDEINMRTYACAEIEVYGSSQQRVVGVREFARRNPKLIAKLKPRLGGLLIENDYPLVGGGHRRDVVVRTPPTRGR